MNHYRADLHMHTVLSPCGDLEMSPHHILDKASQRGLDIIAITDHNTTLHAQVISSLSGMYGIRVISGAEVTSKEEVHCVCLLPDDKLAEFQSYLNQYLIQIPNDPQKLGEQLVVNEAEEILQEIPYSLLASLDQSIDEINKKVHQLNGLFIPAHIERPMFSLLSQLGFLPNDLNEDALEISSHTTKEAMISKYPHLKEKTLIQSSDAHYIEDIGKTHTLFKMKNRSFEELRKAIHQTEGRNTYI
ncbi:MAG: PHP-associated domain-containing protein [Bacteroidales bacterium]